MVRAFAGDSTITSGLGTCGILVVGCAERPTGGVDLTVVPRTRHPCQTFPWCIPLVPGVNPSSGAALSIVSSHAPGGAEPRSPGPAELLRPLGHDRAVPHHLRGDRAAHRVFPPRRLPPLHRRPARVEGESEH